MATVTDLKAIFHFTLENCNIKNGCIIISFKTALSLKLSISACTLHELQSGSCFVLMAVILLNAVF